MRVVQVGELARLALARSRGIAQPLATFAQSPYFEAAGDIIWVGARLPALHPRAVKTSVVIPGGVTLRFDSIPDNGWLPELPSFNQSEIKKFVAGAQLFAHTRITQESPPGFGALLVGETLKFPLSIASTRVRDLAPAYARDDADGVIETTRSLLGFGTGLTPSGDDLAGAALFGRRFIAPRSPRWSTVAVNLTRDAATRIHAISTALFADLACCQSFAPLHALAASLANGDIDGATRAARKLTSLGHSFGWDMLTGFLIGIAAMPS